MKLFIIKQAHRVIGSGEMFSHWSNIYVVDNEEQAKKDVEKFLAEGHYDNEFIEWTYNYEEIEYFPTLKDTQS